MNMYWNWFSGQNFNSIILTEHLCLLTVNKIIFPHRMSVGEGHQPKIPNTLLLVPLSQMYVILTQLHMASREVLELKMVYTFFDMTLFSPKLMLENYAI